MKSYFANIACTNRRCRKQALSRLAFGLACLFAGTAAHATVLCVGTVNGLVAAFDDANAGAEGSTWDIRLRYGTYQLSGDLIFEPDGSHDNKQFYLSGGWDASCSNQTGKASDSIVRGATPQGGSYTTAMMFYGDNARYDIDRVRFENFGWFLVDDKPCGAFDICPDTDTISIERSEFRNGGSMYVQANDAKHLVFRNNLVTGLNSSDPIKYSNSHSPVTLHYENNEDVPQITFNTFADLDCGDGFDGVEIFSQQPNTALHHNLFQTNNCANSLFISDSIGSSHNGQGGQALTPYYNLFASVDGAWLGNLFANGNVFTSDPKFVDAFNSNFRLQNSSLAVNKGATLVGAIASGFVWSSLDLDGKQRPIGQHFDIGAYESNVYDGAAPVFTVNSTNDTDDGVCNAAHCSLREAINLANAQSGSEQHIGFNIPGSCPRVIVINKPLPDITGPVTIDGYTQPGSNVNDAEFGSDANICVAITPGATGVNYAFQVPTGQPDSTQLNIRGLAFGSGFYAFGSTGAAIVLRSGAGHRIVGNVFGGYMPSTLAPLGSLARAVLVRGTAKHAHIGTTDAADRNYLGNLGQNGIVLNDATSTGHFIENNYIGVRPDGLTAQANSADGISASGGSGVTINGNTIAASEYGIGLLGANTKNFTVTGNRIGVNALNIGNASLSNSVGIAIGLGSDGHVIGAKVSDDLSAGKFSNLIANNLGDGILLSNDAGPTNTIRGNAIYSNGKAGAGIGIDLGGTLAQLANDAGDADSGPNARQNYPVISGSAANGGYLSTRTVYATLNTSPNKSVRIDFYHSPTCGGVTGANATTFVGSTNVNSGASGIVNVVATIAEAGTSGYLTATATVDTGLGAGQTSELAPCVAENLNVRSAQ